MGINIPNDLRCIVFFDGVCNFCNSSINFIIRHDKKNIFKFATLQSMHFKKLFLEEKENPTIDSVLYFEDGVLYRKSTAALRILKKLGGFYSTGYALIIIPRFIRDFVYDIIAKNRYQWFGKKESCMIPTAEVRAKFME